MKIGISYWGFCETLEKCNVAETPDGHRYGRRMLVDELLKRGHEVYALQQRREIIPYPGVYYAGEKDVSVFPDLDLLFVEWRWPTYKNHGEHKFESDLDRQNDLMNFYHGKIPIIAWDTDLSLTAEDENLWPELLVADPSMEPVFLKRKRTRLTFWTDFNEFFKAKDDLVQYGYIGNNYQREKQFQKYYSECSTKLRKTGIQTTVYGNWLNFSPERPHPKNVVAANPDVAFIPRVGFYDSMKALNNFICTTHISKKNYSKFGNVTVRFFETLACNVPALVPEEFCCAKILGSEWIVKSSRDVCRLTNYLMTLNADDRMVIVTSQRENLKNFHNFHVNEVADYLENVF
jgi:hypothetical protein